MAGHFPGARRRRQLGTALGATRRSSGGRHGPLHRVGIVRVARRRGSAGSEFKAARTLHAAMSQVSQAARVLRVCVAPPTPHVTCTSTRQPVRARSAKPGLLPKLVFLGPCTRLTRLVRCSLLSARRPRAGVRGVAWQGAGTAGLTRQPARIPLLIERADPWKGAMTMTRTGTLSERRREQRRIRRR